MVIPLAKATAQDYGSALTYGRRYALSAIIGIVTDDDDDANQAQPTQKQLGKKKTVTASQQKPSAEQMKQFHTAGSALYGDEWDEKRPGIVQYVTKKRTSSSKHLTLAEWKEAMNGINAKADTLQPREVRLTGRDDHEQHIN